MCDHPVKKKPLNPFYYCACCAATLAGLGSQAGSVGAQETFGSADASNIVEEIVVTARRRSENLQQVPIAISVVTEEDVEQLGITGIGDFTTLVPNVTYDNALNLGTNFLTIRGQTQSQYAPPPAAIVVDGVLTISPLQFNVDKFDLQQVEVLKGPQGAFYGRNAIAGVINLTTRKPGDEFEGRLLAGYGRGDEYKARMSVSGPLINDRLYGSVGVSYTDRGGQIENVTTGDYVDHYEDTTAKLRLVADLSDAVELDFKYTYSEAEGNDPTYITSTTGDPGDMDDDVTANRKGGNPRELHDLSSKLDWSTEQGTLTLILAYVDVQEELRADFDFSPLDIFRVVQLQEEDGFSQEIRFSSDPAQDFRWLLGAYHVKNTREIGANIFLDPFFLMLAPVPTSADFLFDSSFDINRYENYSAFGQMEYDLSPEWELALALRYDEDSNEQNGNLDVTFDEWQPKATLTYKPSESLALYGSLGRGFRAGDFNASGASFGNNIVEAEVATTAELGLKSRILDNQMIANISLFYTDLENGQFKLFDAGGATNVGINIDETRLQGFEIETSAIISAALTINAAVGYTDAKIKKFTPPTGFGGSTEAYIDNTPPRVPDYTVNVGFNYELPVGDALAMFLRSDYRHISSWFWDPENDYERDPVDYIDIRFGVHEIDTAWSITAWVKNALDEKATANYQPFVNSGHPLGIDAYYPPVGTTYGIEATYNF